MKECNLTELDFAGLCKDVYCESKVTDDGIVDTPILDDNGEIQYIYSLRYEEFIAINTYAIQKIYKEYKTLEEKYNKLENTLNKVLEKLNLT